MFLTVLFLFLAYLAFKWCVLIWFTLKHGGPLHVNQAIWEGHTPQEIRKEWRENLLCLLIAIIFVLLAC